MGCCRPCLWGLSAGPLGQWLGVREGLQGHSRKFRVGWLGAIQPRGQAFFTPWFWLLEERGQGSGDPTHGCSQSLKGDLVAPGGSGLGLAWTRNLLCGVFREGEFGPRELILDQMTTECWGQDLGML